MKYDIILYEAGMLALIAALVYMGLALHKLTMVVKQKQGIWVMPVIGAFVLAAALAAHAYASFALFPALGEQIKLLSNNDILQNADKLAAVKAGIAALRAQVMNLKVISFACFFIASLFLAVSTAVYIRWISK
jgi:hypothetical protein